MVVLERSRVPMTEAPTKQADATTTNDSESDNDDEDYVPNGPDGEDGTLSNGEENGSSPQQSDLSGHTLTITKLKAVDDAFLDLFGYTYDANSMQTQSMNKIVPVKSARSYKQRRILSFIFGRNSCLKLMSNAKSNAAHARPKLSSGGMIRLEKRVVKEVKRFAGQQIFVEKVVMFPVMADNNNQEDKAKSHIAQSFPSDQENTPQSAASSAKGLDSLLTTLSRPEKLSTISKTSADWDIFKSKNTNTQLKEELENKAVGNEAFLVKKDFLSRVDERRFEIEKDERNRERARRGN